MINKAAGSDDTCSAIKRQCRCNRSPRSITHLINLSLSSARFLNEWQNAKVAPTVEPRFDEPLYNESPRYRRFVHTHVAMGILLSSWSCRILLLLLSLVKPIFGQRDLFGYHFAGAGATEERSVHIRACARTAKIRKKFFFLKKHFYHLKIGMADTSFALYWWLCVSDYSVILLLFHNSEGVTRLFSWRMYLTDNSRDR